MFAYDMIQDVFLKRPHYHQYGESMTHQLPKSYKHTFRNYETTHYSK